MRGTTISGRVFNGFCYLGENLYLDFEYKLRREQINFGKQEKNKFFSIIHKVIEFQSKNHKNGIRKLVNRMTFMNIKLSNFDHVELIQF